MVVGCPTVFFCLVLQSGSIRKVLQFFFRFRRELLGHGYLDLHQLISLLPAFLNPQSLDPEFPSRLGPRRNLEHDLLAIKRPYPEWSAQSRLRQGQKLA